MYSLTSSFTHTLTHTHTRSLTLTHLLTHHTFTHSLTRTMSFTHTFTHSLTHNHSSLSPPPSLPQDSVCILLLQFSSLLVENAYAHIHDSNNKKQGAKLRRLMTFAWPCLLPKQCVVSTCIVHLSNPLFFHEDIHCTYMYMYMYLYDCAYYTMYMYRT